MREHIRLFKINAALYLKMALLTERGQVIRLTVARITVKMMNGQHSLLTVGLMFTQFVTRLAVDRSFVRMSVPLAPPAVRLFKRIRNLTPVVRVRPNPVLSPLVHVTRHQFHLCLRDAYSQRKEYLKRRDQ